MAQKRGTDTDLRKAFAAAGFEVTEESAGRVAVKKHNFVHYLEPQADAAWLPVGPPYFIIRGSNYELEDRGIPEILAAWGDAISHPQSRSRSSTPF